MEGRWSAIEKSQLDRVFACSVAGSPATVRRGIEAFVGRHKPDELMVTGQIFDHAARLRSFEMVADIRAGH
jgi:alkanesulfonate monooxygenase SsuD/methylene tetrahydromethanopterin reductase-like flavin-dependent oxidoreductase (luciferase family)